MRHESFSLKFPSTMGNGNGPSQTVRNLMDKVYQVTAGLGTYSIAIEFSIDEESTWHELSAAATAATDVAPTAWAMNATHVRLVISGFSSDDPDNRPVVTLAGRNANTSP